MSVSGINKLKVDSNATNLLRALKGRTGLTPNILARFAFFHSISRDGDLNPKDYNTEGMEFNRYTLTGNLDFPIFFFLKHWMLERGTPVTRETLQEYLTAHINRGTLEIAPKIKKLEDLINLFPEDIRNKIKELVEISSEVS